MTTRTTTFPITNYDTNHENIDTNHDDNHDNNIDDSRDYTAMTTTMTTMTQKLRYKRPQRHRESRHNFRPRPLDTQSFITKRFITKRYSQTNSTISFRSFDREKVGMGMCFTLTWFVELHKFAPPLLFEDGEKALPFSTGRTEPQPVPVWPQPPCHQWELIE